MALGARLQLRQTQSLVMTPQLLQSIRLLQLTHVELDHFIDEEIERNPLLERAEAVDEAPAAESVKADDTDMDRGVDEWFEQSSLDSAKDMADGLDASMENVFPDDPGNSDGDAPGLSALRSSETGSAGGGEGFDIGEITPAAITLGQHVREQIAFAFHDPTERLIAEILTDALDEDGYFRAETADFAERLGISEDRIAAVLARCQTFDPPGVFARDLAECLALQLAARNRLDPAIRAMLSNLELLARRDFAQLRRICGVDDEDLYDMVSEIKALDPRPGRAFISDTADIVVPDVVVRPASDGSWAVELNMDAMPRILVNQSYATMVSSRVKDVAEREFVGECLQSANWLVRSLDQRAKTILKVASEIVRQQDAFLVDGVRHLKPLNLRTVADAIGMHESTVSRVTTNKFMMTPRGVFEFRYFFTVAIASAGGGDAHSSEAVRDRIRSLIDAEAPSAVLSDDTIVDLLKADGIDIARRTVAKYREGMNIPSSVQRRREKRIRAAVGA